MTKDEEKLIRVEDLKDRYPWWPWSVAATYRWIRLGKLRAVKIGRRVFLTPALIREFIETNKSG